MKAQLLLLLLSGCVPLPDKGEVFDPDGDGDPYGEDCDNTDPAIGPSQVESPYDGVDNDCDAGTPDDDLDQDGYGTELDCNDQLAVRNPFGSDSTADDCDQNCDGVDGTDGDGDSVASVATGGTDCDDDDPSIHPAVVYSDMVLEEPCDDGFELPEDVAIAEEICEDGSINGCDGGLSAAQACAPSGDLQTWGISSVATGPGDVALRVAGVDDMTGDGVPDLAVASPNRDGESGALFLLSGSDLSSWSLQATLLEGEVTMRLGETLLGVPNQDDDGLPDLLATAPGARAVFVVSAKGGSPDLLGYYLGPTDGTSFGHTLSYVGDITGDSLAEVVIGAPDPTGTSPGVVYLFAGGVKDAVSAETALASVSTGVAGDLFGAVIARGDFAGDGVDDLLLGVPGDDTNAVDSGAVCKLERRPEDTLPDLSACAWLRGGQDGEGMGQSLAVFDWNADGYDDLVTIASGAGESGVVFVFEGPVDRPADANDAYGRLKVQGAALGSGLSGTSDVDADGVNELLVSSRDEDGDGTVWLVYEMPQEENEITGGRTAYLQISGYAPDRAIVSAGDLDQDGYDDLAFGMDRSAGESLLVWVLGSGY